MSSESAWPLSELGREATNSSRPFSFEANPEVVFVNTSDVLGGRFLHSTVSLGEGLPGQAKKSLRWHDILLTEIRPGNGRFAYVDFDPEKYVVSTKFMVIESRGRVVPRFLYHVLTNQPALDEFQRIAESRSGTFPQITFDSIAHFPVPIPPHDQQANLVRFLDALQLRLQLLRETNATLEAIAQALFKSWFVDFDPVHAKQQGIAPAGMDEATAALFPDSFDDSTQGSIPHEWRTATLGAIARTVRRQLHPSELHADIKYVGLEHIPRQSLSLTSWGTADGLESAKAAFSEGDILFGKLRPYFHKVVVAPFSGVCSTDILVCQPAHPAFYGLVTMQLFSTALIEYADRLSNGAKMPRVSWKDIAAYPVVLPPESVALAFSAAIEPMLARMKANVHMSQTLATLRDTLLPRLISGQLRLPEADQQVEHAAIQ